MKLNSLLAVRVFAAVAAVTVPAFLLIGCGKSSSSDTNTTGGNGSATPKVNWQSVSTEYNPSIETQSLSLVGVDTLNLDLVGFKDDVALSYSSQLSSTQAQLRIFKVYKDSAYWPSISQQVSRSALNVSTYGIYQCSIRSTNGRIASLKGGCIVRVEVILPAGAQVEVYNVGARLSKRFKAVSNESFLMQLDKATWTRDKLAVIDDFLYSHAQVSRAPVLETDQLGHVLHAFSFKSDKLAALSRLHTTVHGRVSLARVIDNEFSYFDRNEARAIAGLPKAN